jgi:hypothetical protein
MVGAAPRSSTHASTSFPPAGRRLPRFAIGEQARQWVGEGESGLGTMLRYVLVWRDRNVDTTIVVTGGFGVVSAFDVAPPRASPGGPDPAALH